MNKSSQEKNQIKVGFQTRIGSVVTYSKALIDTEKFTVLSFSAIGGAIGSLVNIVEVLKTLYPKLHQVTKISSVAHQTLDNNNSSVINERLSPKLDVTLSFEKPTLTGDGYQEPYPEEVRQKLQAKLDEARNRQPRDGETRGGRGFQSRGGRGRGFSSRGGERGQSRGGRGRGFSSKGGERGQPRGGRGFSSRGGERGRGFSSRGGERGRGFSSRGGERGRGFSSRGGERGQTRGGRGFSSSRGGY